MRDDEPSDFDSDDDPSLWHSFCANVGKALQCFEKFTADVIYDRAEGNRAQVFGWFLHALSFLFAGCVKLRMWLYKNRILQDEHLGCMVIVVGNLTMGGTGEALSLSRFVSS